MKRRGSEVVVGITLLVGAFGIAHADSDDWPMYGRTPHHSFARTDSVITAANAGLLQSAWTFTPGDAVTASPTVVGGVVYVGSWDGFFYALDRKTGNLKWKFLVNCDNIVTPIPPQCGVQDPSTRFQTDGGLITSTALVRDGKVYFGGGKTMYALRARDGKLLWKKVICGNPEEAGCENDPADFTRIFASPVFYDGRIYITHSVDGEPGYRGGIKALDAEDGHIAWKFEIDPFLDSHGKPLPGPGQNRGCGNSFGSLALDEARELLFVGTSDCQADATPPYHEAVLALHADSGHIAWVFRPRKSDTCDFDFGASANIFSFDDDHTFVGIGGKDGTYYTLDARTGAVRWATNVVFGGSAGGFIGTAAFDGKRIYGGTGYGDLGGAICMPSNPADQPIEDPSFHAFDLRTGAVDWEQTFHYTFGASTVANGVVLNGWAGLGSFAPSALTAFDSATGNIVGYWPQPGSLNSGVTISGKMIFFGTGNTFDGAGSTFSAMALP